ncbi:MAG: hypothetical protein U9Q76_00105 [candidate division WOR-3 bacterium]|nr:hypothetical protein [candidate division WOR-3 bacterium]
MAKPSALQKHLRNQYLPIFQKMMGMSPAQAKRTFKDLFAKVTEEARKEDTLNLPPDLGDRLLEKQAEDKKVRELLAKKRHEGVRDEDIRWWWNMHDLERRMISKVDEVFIYALFLKFTKEDGLTHEEANKKVWEIRPMFGNPEDTSYAKGKDRPLPDELRQRVNTYMTRRVQKDPEGLKKDAEACSSFNAFARKEIQAARL